MTITIGITLFLVAIGVYAVAAEISESPGSGSTLGTLRVLLTTGGIVLAVLGARSWSTRKQ